MSSADEEVGVGPRPADDGLFYAMSSSLVFSFIAVYVLYFFAGWLGAVVGAVFGLIATFMLTPHIVAAYFRIPLETLLELQ